MNNPTINSDLIILTATKCPLCGAYAVGTGELVSMNKPDRAGGWVWRWDLRKQYGCNMIVCPRCDHDLGPDQVRETMRESMRAHIERKRNERE